MKKRVFVLFLVFTLLINEMSSTVSANSGQSRIQESKSIAVVFDNSGSMYTNNNKAWCRATYAMEVFAAMMNDGDTMAVYPMHPIEIDGKQFSRTNPVVISGPKDAESIRKMYTPNAADTPIEAIVEAYNGLIQTSGEKWLVVLTDGDVFYENGSNLGNATVQKLTERFDQYINNVNILYLGIGSVAAMPALTGGKCQFHADKASDSAEVLNKLTNMCNMIFGRDTMKVSGNAIEMDVSMKKLIVFVQGKDVSDIRVTGITGAEIGSRGETHRTKYSELGAGGYTAAKSIDQNLQGMIITYENCRAGSYQLSYTGEASNVIAYYEPDVDLVVNFLDKNGNLVDPMKDQLTAGEYILQYGLWDLQLDTWTESELMGNTHFTVDYTINGTPYQTSTDERRGAEPIALSANDELDAVISADYLSGYHLEKTGNAFGMPIRIGFRSFEPEDFTVSISGGASEYPLSKLEETGKYKLTAAYQGTPLQPGNGPGSFTPTVEIPGCNIGVEYQPLADGSGYEISLHYNGDPLRTDTGSFTLNYSVTYTDEHNETGKSKTFEVPFTVSNDGYGLNVRLELKQSYYQISQIEQGEPILVWLTKDGLPLTDEELQAVTLNVGMDLPYETQCQLGQSAFALHLKNGDGLSSGVHKIQVTATTRDPLGQPIQDSDELQIELQRYPAWVRTALIALVGLLLAMFVWLYLNTKILPKRMFATVRAYTVDGEAVGGKAVVNYSGGGKKRGTIEVCAPKCPTNPMAKCGFLLELAAVSPRRVKSSARLATVTGVRAVHAANVTGIKIGSVQFIKGPGGAFIHAGAKKDATIEFQIGNKKQCVVSGEAMAPDGGSASLSLAVTLGFQ